MARRWPSTAWPASCVGSLDMASRDMASRDMASRDIASRDMGEPRHATRDMACRIQRASSSPGRLVCRAGEIYLLVSTSDFGAMNLGRAPWG
jgi:hypothetical protein